MKIPRRLLVFSFVASLLFSMRATAHPMGNFSISHYSKVHLSRTALQIDYLLDFAEIPTFQMFPEVRSEAGFETVRSRITGLATDWLDHLAVTLHGNKVPLLLDGSDFRIADGAGGLQTLRVHLSAHGSPAAYDGLLDVSDSNFADRIGWKEIVITADPPLGFPEGNSFAVDRSGGLSNYPADLLSNAPDVVHAAVRAGPVQVSQQADSTSTAAMIVGGRSLDRLAAILSEEALPLRLILFGSLIAFALGALHALSPGHGKTIVAAYLIGNRGTARHAMFLGAVVTFTHTAGVFALGFVTLFLSRYVVPESLYPWIGFASGMTIVAVGVNLLRQRLGFLHDHGPNGHSHEIPGAVTLRSLLGLGFSGGILPCPSALVVLLSAIALHRIAIGLLFIVAFSLGLASVLVAIGVLVVRASRLLPRFGETHWAARAMPVISAAIISTLGLGIAAQSIVGVHFSPGFFSLGNGALAVLGLGLFLGLKHATDADHVVAVTTFVSQERSVFRSCWIGACWGLGHTLSLAVAGLIVIGLKVGISEWLAARLEFGVAIMLVVLGARVLFQTARRRPVQRAYERGLRPLVVGAIHGAAGSAALMLLVLSTIRSPLQGFLYIAIFGFGSMLGMLVISLLLALPIHWIRARVGGSFRSVEVMAGVFSCAFGLFLGVQIFTALS